MKRLVLLPLVFLALSTFASAQNLKFDTFYDAPAFSAEFVHEGTTIDFGSQELDSKVGKVTQNMYKQTFSEGKGVIIVAYIDRPAGSTVDLEASLNGMVAKLPNAKETRPRYNAPLGKLDSRGGAATGVYGEGESAFNAVVFVRAAVDNNHIWSMVFMCTRDIPCSEADASTFFNNIKIK